MDKRLWGNSTHLHSKDAYNKHNNHTRHTNIKTFKLTEKMTSHRVARYALFWRLLVWGVPGINSPDKLDTLKHHAILGKTEI